LNHGWSASRLMNRCPTVPVAPKTATIRCFVTCAISSKC